MPILARFKNVTNLKFERKHFIEFTRAHSEGKTRVCPVVIALCIINDAADRLKESSPTVELSEKSSRGERFADVRNSKREGAQARKAVELSPGPKPPRI